MAENSKYAPNGPIIDLTQYEMTTGTAHWLTPAGGNTKKSEEANAACKKRLKDLALARKLKRLVRPE